jgi:hypothetical protein
MVKNDPSLTAAVDAISYLPNSGLYRLENSDRYFEWYMDAETGELLKWGFKANLFLEDKGILGWLNLTLHSVIEFPMLLLLVSLAISGIYLFINPYLLKKDWNTHLTSPKVTEIEQTTRSTQ